MTDQDSSSSTPRDTGLPTRGSPVHNNDHVNNSSVRFDAVEEMIPPQEEGQTEPINSPPPATAAPATPSVTATAASSSVRSQRPGIQKQNPVRIDIATGRITQRQQSIQQVVAAPPCNKWSKFRIMGRFGGKNNKPVGGAVGDSETPSPGGVSSTLESIVEGDVEAEVVASKKQYRIKSTKMTEDGKTVNVLAVRSAGVVITNYLHWTFTATFGAVILATFIQFMFITVVWATFIYWVGEHQPECIIDGNESGSDFLDAYHLSWTTLSTVGYGVTFPSNASTGSRCVGANMLMALESFVGVLFAGITGAIIFSKVARVQSIAQVMWSHPICVRYGTGVMESVNSSNSYDDDEDNTEHTDTDDQVVQLPCPMLEFRVMNEMSNQSGGEIMNASLNVVAATLAAKVDDDVISQRVHNKKRRSLVQQANKKVTKIAGKAGQSVTLAGSAATKTGAALFGAGRKATTVTGSLMQRLNLQLMGSARNSSSMVAPGIEEEEPYSEKEVEKALEKEFQDRLELELSTAKDQIEAMMESNAKAVAVDEGSGSLAPRQIYHSLEMETDNHPFFKRMWNIRHLLNEHSPLLSGSARRMIVANGGCWPEALNSHEEVRKHLHFHEIIVSFSGTSNASGSSVYAQKVYDFVDVNIGYEFVTALRMSEKSTLTVDHALLNDVVEQHGGGGEPFLNIREDIGAAEQAAQIATAAAMTAAETATAAAKTVAGGVKDACMYTTDTVTQTGETVFEKGGDGFAHRDDNPETVINVPTGASSTDVPDKEVDV